MNPIIKWIKKFCGNIPLCKYKQYVLYLQENHSLFFLDMFFLVEVNSLS